MTPVTGPIASPVSATAMKPGYDVTLTDGVDTVGFVVVGADGERDYTQFRDRPIEQMAIQTSQGESSYADRQWPYQVEAQEDWTGGRGARTFSDDKTRYFDSQQVHALTPGQLTLSGNPRYTGAGQSIVTPGLVGVNIVDMHTANKYFAKKFAAPAANTTVAIRIRVTGNTTISGAIYSDTGTVPNALVGSVSTVTGLSSSPLFTEFQFAFTGLTPSTSYWFVLYYSGATTSLYPSVYYDSSGGGAFSANGTSWTPTIAEPYCWIFQTLSVSRSIQMFEYKGALYAYTRPSSGNSILYICGDRGAADANTGALNTLVDASKSAVWTVDEFAGKTVLITAGPGSGEDQPWRTIASNSTTALTVSPSWKIEHTIATEYVILDADTWRTVADLGALVTDHVATKDFVYFALDETAAIYRYCGYTNIAGVWTNSFTAETFYARYLAVYFNETDGHSYLAAYRFQSAPGLQNTLAIMRIPPTDGGAFRLVAEFPEATGAWDDRVTANVTVTDEGHPKIAIGASFTTGIAAVKNFATPVDMRGANYVAMLIRSSATTALNDIRFVLDDNKDLGKWWTPAGLIYNESRKWHLPEVASLDDTEHSEWVDGDTTTGATASITTTTYIYLGSAAKFDRISVDLGATLNNNASVIDLEYWTGTAWVNVAGTVTDGTDVAGATHGQDGEISFIAPNNWDARTKTGVGLDTTQLYYVRYTVSADLDANVNIQGFLVAQVDVYESLDKAIDGLTGTYVTIPGFTASDVLYVGWADRFNKVDIDVGTVNAVTAALTCEYFNGSRWVATTITDGTVTTGVTLAKDGTILITTVPYDWERSTVNGVQGYWIRLYPNTGLTANITINEVRVSRNNNILVEIPVVTANQSQWITFAVTSTEEPLPADSIISSIGLEVLVDKGAITIEVLEGPYAISTYPQPIYLGDRINGLEMYSSDETGGAANLWLFGERKIFEYQTQSGLIVEFPLGEIRELGGPRTGKASCVNGVYLFFTLGEEKIERYYNKNLDDIGPDADEGLPANRRGKVSELLSYPGRVYAGIDAGISGYSSILALKGSAWHDVYVSLYAGQSIHSMYHQNLPGKQWGRLWISEGDNLLWVPIAPNPYSVSDFVYDTQGYLITAWIDLGMKDVQKVVRSLEVFADNVDAGSYIAVDYQKDSDTSWTAVGGNFDTMPSEEIIIGTVGITAKRVRLRVRLATIDRSQTPRLLALVLKMYGVIPIKYEWGWSSLLENDYLYVDLNGRRVKPLGNAAITVAYNKLRSWIDGATILTMNTRNGLDNGKSVVLQAAIKRPRWQYDKETTSGTEEWVIDIAVNQI